MNPIEAQERRGQRELLATSLLPNPDQRFEHIDRDAIEALGVVLGEPVPGDELFVHATLPDGWSRKGSDHDMWSYIVDDRGEERIGVFYKAAFYDRNASMHTIPLCSECTHSSNAHPYAGVTEKAGPENGWHASLAPLPCVTRRVPVRQSRGGGRVMVKLMTAESLGPG